MSDTLITDLQLDLVERAKSDAFFDVINVIHERKGDITQEVLNSLAVLTATATKIGACVVAMSPIASDEMPNVTFGPLDLDITFLVLEDVVINTGSTGTGKAALTIARHLVDTFKHYQPVGLAHPLIPKVPTIVPVENPFAPVAYEVRFRTTESDGTITQKVATPDISPSSGATPQTVTVTCGTADAQIYYTLDGSFPRSGNAAAVLYSGPIAVNSPAILRAGAYKSGSIPSNVNQAKYT